jgi:hypothetical protein
LARGQGEVGNERALCPVRLVFALSSSSSSSGEIRGKAGAACLGERLAETRAGCLLLKGNLGGKNEGGGAHKKKQCVLEMERRWGWLRNPRKAHASAHVFWRVLCKVRERGHFRVYICFKGKEGGRRAVVGFVFPVKRKIVRHR